MTFFNSGIIPEVARVNAIDVMLPPIILGCETCPSTFWQSRFNGGARTASHLDSDRSTPIDCTLAVRRRRRQRAI